MLGLGWASVQPHHSCLTALLETSLQQVFYRPLGCRSVPWTAAMHDCPQALKQHLRFLSSSHMCSGEGATGHQPAGAYTAPLALLAMDIAQQPFPPEHLAAFPMPALRAAAQA